MHFTQSAITREKLSPGKTERFVWDDDLPGFGMRLRAGGKRTWVVQYRLGTKQRRVSLTKVSPSDLDGARKIAKELLAKVTLGIDPQAQKIEARTKAAQTLGVAIEQYLEQLKERLKPRSYKEVERHLRRHWAPLHGLGVSSVTRANVASRVAELKKESGAVAANRSRTSLSAFYSWIIREGLADTNPVIGTNTAGEEISRDRILTNHELVAVWKSALEDDYGRIIRLLILTAQRREEVGGISDQEIDVAKKLWLIPAGRAKNGLPHQVPLSESALSILADAPRRKASGHLFGEADGRPFSGWSKARKALDSRLMNSAPDIFENAMRWTLHDIRRTVATRMAEIGIQPHVIEAILNHVSGHKSGVAGIYNRSTYEPEKRQALDRWATHVEVLTSGASSHVLPLIHVA